MRVKRLFSLQRDGPKINILRGRTIHTSCIDVLFRLREGCIERIPDFTRDVHNDIKCPGLFDRGFEVKVHSTFIYAYRSIGVCGRLILARQGNIKVRLLVLLFYFHWHFSEAVRISLNRSERWETHPSCGDHTWRAQWQRWR